MYKKLSERLKTIYSADPAKYTAAYLTYNGKFSDMLSLYSTFGVGKHDYSYIYGTNDYGTGAVRSFLTKENYTDRTNKFIYGDIRGTLNLMPNEKLRMILGVQGKSTKLDWNIIENYKPYDRLKETEKYLSPYVQAEYRPTEQILAVAGVRYNKYTYAVSNDKSAVSPRFSLSYFPFAGTKHDYTTLWGSYTESFNTPEASHMFGYINYADPNPNIKPEKTKGVEFGIKQRITEWANLEFSYFITNYRDKIAMRPSSTKHGRMFQNINKSQIKGYEAKFEVYPTEWLTLFVNYTDFKHIDKTTNQRLNDRQANEILQYGVSISDLGGFYASLIANRLSDYKNNASVAYYTKEENHISDCKTLVDLKFLYNYRLPNGLSIEPYLSVNNLTNKEYYEGWVPALIQKRNYMGGVNFRLDF